MKITMNELLTKIEDEDFNKDDKNKIILQDVTTEQFKIFKQTSTYKSLIEKNVQVHIQKNINKPKQVSNLLNKKDNITLSFKDILKELSNDANISTIYNSYYSN